MVRGLRLGLPGPRVPPAVTPEVTWLRSLAGGLKGAPGVTKRDVGHRQVEQHLGAHGYLGGLGYAPQSPVSKLGIGIVVRAPHVHHRQVKQQSNATWLPSLVKQESSIGVTTCRVNER
jgi:hypothetical protein